MNQPEPSLTTKEIRDLKLLLQFTAVYCHEKHHCQRTPVNADDPALSSLPFARYPVCADCRDFLLYAFERRVRCPLEDKPPCKHCPVHCYKPAYREKVREVMRFSGQHLIKRGRFDLLWHYFF